MSWPRRHGSWPLVAISLSPCERGSNATTCQLRENALICCEKIHAGMVQPGTITMVRPWPGFQVVQPHAVAGDEPSVGGLGRAGDQQAGQNHSDDCPGACHAINCPPGNPDVNANVDEEPPSRRNALIALVAVVLLVVAGIWISRVLHESGRIEDCLMRGGRNCVPLDTSQPR